MTEHLPEVVRWSEYVDGMVISPTGYFVTYADHVAALRACVSGRRPSAVSDQTEDARCTDWNHVWMQGCKTCVERETEARVFVDRTDHWNAALDAARGAVAAVEMGGEHFWSVGFRDGITIALDAIDALRGESNE